VTILWTKSTRTSPAHAVGDVPDVADGVAVIVCEEFEGAIPSELGSLEEKIYNRSGSSLMH